jgi:hypothetical protein
MMEATTEHHLLDDLELMPLPEGAVMVTGAVVMIQYLDADGDHIWAMRTTDGVDQMTRLGALMAAADTLRKSVQDGWQED